MPHAADTVERAVQAMQCAVAQWAMRLRMQPPAMRAALAASAIALVALQWGLRPWLQSQAELVAQALRERAGPAELNTQAGVPDKTAPISQTNAGISSSEPSLWDRLPQFKTQQSDLDVLVATATRLDLPLPRAQVRRVDAVRPLLVEEIDLELEAPYPTIRRYVARCLNELPHASVRRIRLERAASQGAPEKASSTIRATVTLRLHYRAEAAP